MMDPLRNNCGTVNTSTQTVVMVAVADNAEANNPKSPPIIATRVKVIA